MSRRYGEQVEAGRGYADDTTLTSMFVYRPGIRDMTDWNGEDPITGEVLPSLTRQEFSDECDINGIMKKYEKTGMLPVNGAQPSYVDFTAVPSDLQEAMRVMMDAETAFMSLPASVRKEFDNDALRFVEYAQNGDNLEQLREWGLAEPEKAPEAPMRVEVVNSPVVPPAEPAKPD